MKSDFLAVQEIPLRNRWALPEQQSYLKPGVSIEALDRIAQACSDTEAARRMQEAKRKLFLGFRQERKSA